MTVTDAQLERYARHIILDEVGEEGQEALLAARVLVVGAGGLGAPVLQYLAAAGVGTLGVADDDTVDLSNLQRQIVHTTERVGQPKVASAAASLAAINPEVAVDRIAERLTAANAGRLVAAYDIVVDGSDNFATRYLLNDACYFARKPLVSGALLRFEGQVATFRPWRGGDDNPCYRCLFPEAPPAGLVPRCEEVGIFGAVAGVIGTLQAAEVLKLVLGLGAPLTGRLLLYDALGSGFQEIRARRDPDCALCGSRATIRDLSGHAG